MKAQVQAVKMFVTFSGTLMNILLVDKNLNSAVGF
jgi:hypothetical protein